MKCPERYVVTQQNIRKPIIDIDNIVRGDYNLLIETQMFGECYKENCAAWDIEKNRCNKFIND